MKVTVNDIGDHVCEHGTAVDVHCCNCHHGFLFDADSCVCEDGSGKPDSDFRVDGCGDAGSPSQRDKDSSSSPSAASLAARLVEPPRANEIQEGDHARMDTKGEPVSSRTAPTAPDGSWQQMADAGEMLWVMLANVSGGDWKQQSDDWQKWTAHWRDNYFKAITAHSQREQDLWWALDNIYTIARRETRHGDERGRWAHVLRLCEQFGCESRGVLRQESGEPPSTNAVGQRPEHPTCVRAPESERSEVLPAGRLVDPSPPQKNQEDVDPRVGPPVDCDAPVGSTAEQRTGTVIAAERTEERHWCAGCGHCWQGEIAGVELCGDCWRRSWRTAKGLVFEACGAKWNLLGPLVCQRERGHLGNHLGFNEELGDPIWWAQVAPRVDPSTLKESAQSFNQPEAVKADDRCSHCGGPYTFDVSIPSVRWNAVIRASGLTEYLCATCILREFARRCESFTATLSGDGFNLLPIEVVVNGQAAKDVEALNDENNRLRCRVRELEELSSAARVDPSPLHQDLIDRLELAAQSTESNARCGAVTTSVSALAECARLFRDAAEALRAALPRAHPTDSARVL